MESAANIIGLSLLLGLSGCTATCLRDSDCIGASVCLQDRCVLPSTPSATSNPTSNRAIGDAGGEDVGSAATATRGFFDAVADAASSEPRP